MKLFLLFFLPLYLQANTLDIQVQESECGHLDYRDAFDYEPRNQEKINWCYAFTTADLIGFEYGLEKLSAADIALNYNRNWIPSKMNAFARFYYLLFKKNSWVERNREWTTGFIKIAVDRALKKGLCVESESPDNFLTRVNKKKRFSERVSYLNAMDEILKTARAYKKGELSLRDTGFYYKTPKTSEKDYIEIIENYPVNQIMFELNDRSCKERIQLPSREFSYYFKGSKFFSRLDRQLERKKLVSIDYHGRVRKNPHEFEKGINGLHTSFIVGRRYDSDKKTCEYLVRDSLGTKACHYYHKGLKCEEGHFWMSKEILYDALVSYGYFR